MDGTGLVLAAFAGTVVVAAATVGLVRWLAAREPSDGDEQTD